jgi:glycosyltransferase involved in cell wall biosynthesis
LRSQFIIRLCRSLPSDLNPGVGRHCFLFSQWIGRPTLIFTKEDLGNLVDFPENVTIVKIRYSDLVFENRKVSLIKFIIIFLSKIWGELIFAKTIISYCVKNQIRPNIIHVHSINYLLCAVVLKYIFKCSLFMNFGGTDLLRLKTITLMKSLVRRVDSIFYVAKSMEFELKALFPYQDLVYFGNGVNLESFKPSLMARKNHIVSIGSLRWQKSYSDLILAFEGILKLGLDMRLRIIGDGPESKSLRALTVQCGIDDRVEFIKVASRQEIVQYLSEALIFVSSSVSEGNPKAILEAIAVCTPVVVTDVGDGPRAAECCGLVVPPSDIDALTRSITRLIKENDLWVDLSEHCLSKRQEFSWKSVELRVRSAYLQNTKIFELQ